VVAAAVLITLTVVLSACPTGSCGRPCVVGDGGAATAGGKADVVKKMYCN
jgi:hypothetical protein